MSPRKNSLRNEVHKLTTREYFTRNIQPSDADHNQLISLYFKELKKDHINHRKDAEASVKVKEYFIYFVYPIKFS